MMLIGLVSCTKSQTPHAASARELYSPSALFRGALRNLEGRAAVVYVLSDMLGLLPLDEQATPHALTLKDASPAERQAWAEGVQATVCQRHGASLKGITFEFHAGVAYRQPLEELLAAAGATCVCPVEGLSIGERLGYYAEKHGPVAVPDAPGVTDLRLFVWGLQGKVLETETGEPFLVVEVKDDRVVVVPDSTKKPRPIRWAELEGAWEELRVRGSMTLAEVGEVALEANPAYVFAMLGEMPGVRLERGRPMRLRVVGM